MSNPLLVLGASARAAAASSLRAGFTPFAGDMFADVDLRAICPTVPITVADYPQGFEEVAAAAPPGPWMYTGGLENHPALVSRIAAARPLYGNQGAALMRARDPFFLADALRGAGLAFPECAATATGLPRDGSWLRKRRRSSGGLHVHALYDSDDASNDAAWYFQRRVTGMPYSAVYVAAAGEARWLGATEQCLDESESLPFRYAGSLGPLPLPASVRHQLEKIGQVLAQRCGLVGLFGVDAIVQEDTVWTIEVNPRYTASIEILERALGVPTVTWHVEACRDGVLPVAEVPTTSGRWCGKRIMYAPRDVTVPDSLIAGLVEQNAGLDWPLTADLPTPGTRLEAGAPVLTVFAEADDRAALLLALDKRIAELTAQLH